MWTPQDWRACPIAQAPHYPDAAALDAVEAELRQLPAAGLRRRGARAEGAAGRGRRRQGVPAAGRRLRRELRRVPRQQHPRHVPRAAADGGGADLRRRLPVVKVGRMAGQFAKPRSRRHRDAWMASRCRRIAATSSTTSSSMPQAARPIPRGCCAGLQPVGDHAQPAARLRPGRLSPICARVQQWNQAFIAALAAGRALRGDLRDRIQRGAGVHGGLRDDRPTTRRRLRATEFYTSHEALLLPYEEALTRQDSLTGDWYACSAHLPVDRRPHPPGGRRACRVPARRRQSARDEMRADA